MYRTSSGWALRDLSASTGAPNASGGTLNSYVDNSGGQHVWYTTSSQRVYELYWNPSSQVWTSQDLTSATGGALARVGSPITGFADFVGTEVFYIGANQHIYQMYYNSGTHRWSNSDVSGSLGAPTAETTSYLTGFSDSVGEHIYYTANDHHIYQLYWNAGNGRWSYQDLTAATGALSATSGSPLTSFGGTVGEHVYYQTLYNGGTALGELYWSSSSGWRANAPLALSGVNPFTAASPMTSLYCIGSLPNGQCK